MRGGRHAGLLLIELVTNPVLHANCDIVVQLVRLVDELRLEVADRSPAMRRQRRFSVEATTGRALALVAAFARSWGTRPDGSGKVVWRELADASPRRRNRWTASAGRQCGRRRDAFLDLDRTRG